jgi:hypothetical protein
VSGQLHAPAALPRKWPRYPLDRSLGEPQNRSERRGENSWPYRDSNSDPSVLQPVASRYPGSCGYIYTLPKFKLAGCNDSLLIVSRTTHTVSSWYCHCTQAEQSNIHTYKAPTAWNLMPDSFVDRTACENPLPQKHWFLPTDIHGVISQKTYTFIITALRTSNLTWTISHVPNTNNHIILWLYFGWSESEFVRGHLQSFHRNDGVPPYKHPTIAYRVLRGIKHLRS